MRVGIRESVPESSREGIPYNISLPTKSRISPRRLASIEFSLMVVFRASKSYLPRRMLG